MAQTRADSKTLDRRPIKELQPHVVVQFWDNIESPYEPGVEDFLEENGVVPWEELVRTFGEVRLIPLFTALEPDDISVLQKKATESDPEYNGDNLLRFWRIDAPHDADLDAIVKVVSQWQAVKSAYVDRPAPDPVVMADDDPRSANQMYLDAAPDGIDAEYAWGFIGGDGQGQTLIDMERGWTFDHEDLVDHGVTLIHGQIRDASRSHGTSVLGQICAVDNTVGCIGIAPAIERVDAVSYWMSNRPDAILAAIANLEFGDVLLLEAQVWVPNGTPGLLGPIEVLDADYEAIRLASALGIIVVEAGGNGTNNGSAPALDLDTYTNSAGLAILWRDDSNTDFRDSGAIIVTAATSTAPHTRRDYGPFGERIDCYGWSQNIDTLRSNSSGATDLYTTSFGGTSGASPIVAGAAILVQGIAEHNFGFRLSPGQMRAVLSDPGINTNPDTSEPTNIGTMPDLHSIIDNVLNVAADVYIRDNPADTGDPHAGPISSSPDIITLSSQVASPQAQFGEGSGTEDSLSLGSTVTQGQDNFIYMRVRNRGSADAENVRATVFWSEVSTLVTPDLWNFIGDTIIDHVPGGNILTVSDAITWQNNQIPPQGHYCYVGLVGNGEDPPPNPAEFIDWENFRQFVLVNNNVTWRNFNVIEIVPDAQDESEPVVVNFLAPGAPDRARPMTLEVYANFPKGTRVGLQMARNFAEQLVVKKSRFSVTVHDRGNNNTLNPFEIRKPGGRQVLLPLTMTPVDLLQHLEKPMFGPIPNDQVIMPVNPHGRYRLGTALFPAKSRNPMKLFVDIPEKYKKNSYDVYVRQLFDNSEVGRVTWRFKPG